MTTRIARYCACGGSLTGRVEPDYREAQLAEAFEAVHDGPDCAPATQSQAAAARRRADRKAANSRT